jgi:RNA polymerase sigma factor (sigma-70 family)
MRWKRDDSPEFGSCAYFQMLLDGGPQRTAREQAWDNAAQRFRLWLNKHGKEAQALRSRSDKTINQQPWLTVPRWKLNRALRSLPRGYREVFDMHEFLGYTHKEIADSLNCAVGTSKSQLHKARGGCGNCSSENNRGKLCNLVVNRLR